MGIMIRQEVATVPVFLGSCFFVCENSDHVFQWTIAPTDCPKKGRNLTVLQIVLLSIVLQTEMRNTCEWTKEDARHFASETPL